MSEWIHVCKKLPENEIYVIATDGKVVFMAYHSWSRFSTSHDNYQHVTHWMPLPEPPQ